MDYDWPNLAVMIDLNKGNVGADLTGAKGYIDAVQIYLGHPVPGDPQNPYYDLECANNYERAIAAGIPAIGLVVDLKASFWTTDPWKVNLEDVRTQDKSKNPVYVFVEHFFASTRIQADMEKTPITFITLVVDETVENGVWNMADLLANISHLNDGMAKGKIPKVKIFVAAIPELVNSQAWIQGLGTKEETNLFEQYFYHSDVPYGVMVQSAQSKPGNYTWATLKNCLPAAGVRPVYKLGAKKGEVTYLGAMPCPWWWSHTLGGVFLPNGKGGLMQFGISSSFYTASALYSFLGIKSVVVTPPPVGHNCASDETWNETTQKCEKNVVAPPVGHNCASDETWNEASQKCEKNVISLPPSDALVKLQASVDKVQAFLEARFR